MMDQDQENKNLTEDLKSYKALMAAFAKANEQADDYGSDEELDDDDDDENDYGNNGEEINLDQRKILAAFVQ